MAAIQQKQQQQQIFPEDSLNSFNSKLNKTRENTYLGENDNEKTKKKTDDDTESRKTLKAFLSESLLYDPKLVNYNF
jgi:hypothetical protein